MRSRAVALTGAPHRSTIRDTGSTSTATRAPITHPEDLVR
ncbi:hypothetical protein EDF20_1634 [Frigoribacterium sp. PhB116]|nr:hypothetical protein EDF20_1634 [Frigoribacterium sp. PhB116]